MSASKTKSQKGNPKSKAAVGNAASNQYEDNEEYSSLTDDTKKTETSDQKLKEKSKGADEDGSDNEENHDVEEKILEGAKDQSRNNQTDEPFGNGHYFSLSNWWNKLPAKFGSVSAQNGVSNGTEYSKNLLQKLEPYQHKINSCSTALVSRTKILILAIFWLHVVAWLGLSLLLGIINIFTFLAGPWSLFPVIGWSIILLGHFIITHRLLKGAGQNDLEWADAKLWEYVDHAKELSSDTFSTCKAKSQTVIVQTRTTLSSGYTCVRTHVYRFLPQTVRQKFGGHQA